MAVPIATPVAGAGGWVRHTHGGRAFYHRWGDDASLTLAAPRSLFTHVF